MFFIALIVCVFTLAGYFVFFKSPAQSVCSNNGNNVKETVTDETATTADKTSSSTVSTATVESSSKGSSNETGATFDAKMSSTLASQPTLDVDTSSAVLAVDSEDISRSSTVVTRNDSFSASDEFGNSPAVETCQIVESETVLAVEETAVQSGAIDTAPDAVLKSFDDVRSDATTIESVDTAFIQQGPPSVVITEAEVTHEPNVEEFIQSQSDVHKNAESSSNIHSEKVEHANMGQELSHHTETEIQNPKGDEIQTHSESDHAEPEIQTQQAEDIQAQPEPIFPTEVEVMQTEDSVDTPVEETPSAVPSEPENQDDLQNSGSDSTLQPDVESSPSKSAKNVHFTTASSEDKLNSNDVTALNDRDITQLNDNNVTQDENVVNHNVVNQNGVTQSSPVLINSDATEFLDDFDDMCVTPKNDIQNGECWHQSCDSIDEIVETDTFDIDSGCRSKPKLKRQETLYDCAEVVTFVSRMNVCCAIFKNPADHKTHYYRKRFKVPKDEEAIPTELRNIAASFRLWGRMWDRIHHIKICQKSCEMLEKPSKAVRRLDDQREDCQNKFGCRISLQDFDCLGSLEKKVLGDLLDKIHNNFVSEDDLAYFNLQDDSELMDKFYFDL